MDEMWFVYPKQRLLTEHIRASVTMQAGFPIVWVQPGDKATASGRSFLEWTFDSDFFNHNCWAP